MKTIMKKLVIDEKGAALILALILLLIGGLISTALLGHMGSGILAGQVHERRTAELYAADAGVEDAMWNIQHGEAPTGACNDTTRSYNISDVNGKSVHVTIDYQDGGTYRITSIAATDDGGGTAAIASTTTVEAYVTGKSKYGDYSGILDQVITSCSELDLPNNPNVVIEPGVGEVHGPIDNYCDIGPWPEAEDIFSWYLDDVKGETHYYGDSEIDLKGISCPPGPIYVNNQYISYPSGLEPLYVVDGGLTIKNSVNTAATLSLNGTIYITGDTIIKPTQDVVLSLNGQTIFVASNNPDSNYALEIGGKCTIEGPGAIIAIGDIYFEPNIEAGMNAEPVFVFSVSGTTWIQPGVNFLGSIAGDVLVDIQPNAKININYPDEEGWYEGLNFPIGDIQDQQLVYSIDSWEITQQ